MSRRALYTFVYRALLTLIIFSLTIIPANAAAPDSAKAEPKWDVANPGEPCDTLAFDASEGAWISLDVSPDGKTIVFDLLGDIYAMPITGGNATVLAGGLPYETQPRFSPDGKWISFTSDRAGGDNIWIMKPDGSERTQITKEDYRLLNNANWHPSGQYLIARKHFTSGRSMGAGEMWLYRVPDGGAGVGLTTRKNDQQDAGEPIFSPDGKYLYWSEDMTPGGYFQYNKDPNGTIYVVRRLDLATNEIRDIISLAGSACRPQISPDGKTMAFVRRVRTKNVLALYNLESGEVRHLWDGLDEDQQETWAIFGPFPGYSWTPDGQSIVITAKGKIWRVDVASGSPTEIPFKAHMVQTPAKAVRFDQAIAGDKFPVKVIRWPQVLPNGKDVVFQALGYLYRYNPATDARARITRQTGHFEFAPSLSPDGKSLVCVTWNDQNGGRIKTVRLDNGLEQVIVNRPGHYVTASFSPDGQWVVFHRGGGDGFRGRIWDEEPGIYMVDATGRTTPRFLTREGRSPVFSKDGQRIYLQSYDGEKPALVSIDLLGSDRRVLVTSERAVDFRLSPDENWLAFEELWQSYVVPFPHSSVPLSVAPEMTSLPVRRLSVDAGTFLSWSSDSKTVRWSLGPELSSVEIAKLYAPEPAVKEGDKKPESDGPKVRPETNNLGWMEPCDIPNSDFYLVGAKILPMNDLSVIENGVVHVKGQKIVEVGTKDKVTVPAGAKTIDVSGMTLMPGMIDVHAHPWSSNNDIYPQRNWSYLANLAFGVTTMHDPSNNSQMVFANAELVKQGAWLGPRVFSTGTILYGAEGDFKTVINKYEDALSAIKRTAAWGAISVKSYNQPRREQRQMVIKAARSLGIEVVPEGGSCLYYNMTQFLDGHTTIEHPVPVAPLYEPELQLMGRFGTGYTPTLIVGYGGLWGENYWYQHTNVWENKRLMHFTPRSVVDPRSRRRPMAPEEEYHQFALSKTATDVLHRGGNVELGAHGQLQGLGAHWELWMLAQGGMTNHEALRCATWMGARALGMGKQLGSIQPGMLADLIVIDGDPTKDIRQSEQIMYVMVNGRLFDSMTLDQLEPTKRPLPPGPNLDGVLGTDVSDGCIGE